MRRAAYPAAVLAFACSMGTAASAAQKGAVDLPDWTGEWEQIGMTPADGGLFVESTDEMYARWNRPPYASDAKQVAFRDEISRKLMDTAAQAQAQHPGTSAPTPVAFACSFGFPLLMLESPATFEALVTRRQTSLVFSTREVRNIYTDGRKHTPADEIWPTYWGDSIGHWEGATLVVDTIAATSPLLPPPMKKLGAETAVGISGGSGPARIIAMFTGQARFTERIRLLDTGLLEDELTVHDPAALSSPWVIVRQYRRISGVNRLIFQDCEGDTRHQVVNGEVTLRLSP